MDEAVTKQQALESCPFCGPGESVVSLWHDDMANRWRVGCGRCGASSGIHPTDKTEAPAIAAWNRRSQPSAPRAEAVEALTLARAFHDTYERLAPSFGYTTRLETRQFDPASPNGKLMIAVCEELAAIAQGADEGERANADQT